MRRTFFCFLTLALGGALPSTAVPEALVVVVSDQHSAYERSAQLVARVDRLKADHPGVPLAIFINGDSFEYGNVVALRTAGAIDFATFAALSRRGPTVINLGNHEPEFYDVAETVKRLRAAGLTVVSGNLRDRASGEPYAPASVHVQLGSHELTVVGVTTDALATYRLAIRPQLDLRDPVVWAREHFAGLLNPAPLPVVLSHCGLRPDREMLKLVPNGTLFAGGHDHSRYVHRAGATVYFHSGSWTEFASVARLKRRAGQLAWEVEQIRIAADDPVDAPLADLIRTTLAQHLTSEEKAVVGRTTRPMEPSEAAAFAVEAARAAATADAALIGGTTFGAGLPAGDVTRFAFDACVRFDGTLWIAEVNGSDLARILARANQSPETPFEQRGGENLIVVAPRSISPSGRYRLATTNWVATHAKTYLGDNPPALTEQPELTLKAAVLSALNR